MASLSGLGVLLSLVFGCLLLALVGELYYLLWWKKQRNSTDYGNQNKELFYLSCWDKPCSIINPKSSNAIVANPETHHVHDPDVEMGKDLKSLGEDDVESEIMRLACPPRFLFTIKEETNEDLESEDEKSKSKSKPKSKSKSRSLGDLLMSPESSKSPYFSPSSSSPLNSNYNNPLFESTMEAEFNRVRCSPPPKMKFLRDAEEKLYRKMVEEAQKMEKERKSSKVLSLATTVN